MDEVQLTAIFGRPVTPGDFVFDAEQLSAEFVFDREEPSTSTELVVRLIKLRDEVKQYKNCSSFDLRLHQISQTVMQIKNKNIRCQTPGRDNIVKTLLDQVTYMLGHHYKTNE